MLKTTNNHFEKIHYKNHKKTTTNLVDNHVDLEIYHPWQQAPMPTDREKGDEEKIEKREDE